MTGEPPRLGAGSGVSGEALFLPEIEDESADNKEADSADVGAGLVSHQEFVQVANAVADNGDGALTLALGGGAELVLGKQSADAGVEFWRSKSPYFTGVVFWCKIGTNGGG